MSSTEVFAIPTETVTKTCFIVTPMDAVARNKVESVVLPACIQTGYRHEFADEQLSDNIRDGIVTSLAVAPMVIAYLGHPSPGWNNNVMLELGYRMATRKAMVILCDDVPGLQLPFHIRTDRVIRIPAGDVIDPALIEPTIKAIAKQIVEVDKKRTDLLSNQAVAVIHAPRDYVEGSETYYVSASKRASELFGINGRLVGMTLKEFVEARHADMPAYQFNAFLREQSTLATAVSPDAPPVVARVPMVFRKGVGNGRAFLPIIVNYQQVGEIQEFRILYLDVTDNCEWIDDEINDRHCFIAHMDPWCPLLDLPDETHSVFLAYNSHDRQHVRDVYKRMLMHRIKPWYDEEDLRDGDSVYEVIESALETCRTALVFIGKNDFGSFQESIELPTLLNLMKKKKLKVISVLMDDLTEPTNAILQAYKWVSYKELTDDWIKGLHKPKPR